MIPPLRARDMHDCATHLFLLCFTFETPETTQTLGSHDAAASSFSHNVSRTSRPTVAAHNPVAIGLCIPPRLRARAAMSKGAMWVTVCSALDLEESSLSNVQRSKAAAGRCERAFRPACPVSILPQSVQIPQELRPPSPIPIPSSTHPSILLTIIPTSPVQPSTKTGPPRARPANPRGPVGPINASLAT